MAATLIKTALCRTSVRHRPSPSLFYFPGLLSKPWHCPKDFDFCAHLESNFDVIKGEYLDLVANNIKSDYEMQNNEHQLHKGQWDWHSYISAGKLQPSFLAQCPRTAEILGSIPGMMTGLPFAYTFFSTLSSGAHITPHTAPCNLRLRCHFPLIVPSPVEGEVTGLRVADETRKWEEGKCLVFDDSYEHEAFNGWVPETSKLCRGTDEKGSGDESLAAMTDGSSSSSSSGSDRVVLLLDVWHPDLDLEERDAVVNMFGEARKAGWLK